MQNFLLSLLLATFLPWSGLVSAADPEQEEPAPEKVAIQYLNQFPKIRLWIPDSPNLGLQTTAAESLSRVHAMGYLGKIQIIAHPGNRTKLPLLIPGVRSEPNGPQDFGWFSIQWHDPKSSRRLFTSYKSTLERVPFAWSAGDDHPTEAKNSLLAADRFLVLQPRGWKEASGLWMGQKPKFYDLSYLNELDHPSPPETAAPHATSEKTRTEEALDSLLAEHSYLPAYSGWAVQPEELLVTVMALQRIVEEFGRKLSPEKPKPGIIIPAFFDPGFSQKEELRSKLRFYYSGGQTPLMIEAVDLSELQSHPEIRTEFDRLGGVLVVFAGPVPQRSFYDYLMKSNFPPMIEGVATTTFLRRMGKAFTLVGGHDPDKVFPRYRSHPGFPIWKSVTPVRKATPSSLYAFYREYLELLDGEKSKIRDLFTQISKDANNPAQDPFILGLLQTMKVEQDRCQSALTEPSRRRATLPWNFGPFSPNR